jgi:hypothetical protein
MSQPDLMLRLDDTNRITAYFDTYGYSVDDFIGDGFGVYTLRIARDLNHIKTGDLTDDLDRLTRNTHSWQHESAIGKYLAINNKHYRRVSLQGYSQGDWAEVFIYADEEWITHKDSAKTLEAWFRGDIFTVHHEMLHTYTDDDNPNKTLELWESEDALGSCIVESEEDLIGYASDFGLTITK